MPQDKGVSADNFIKDEDHVTIKSVVQRRTDEVPLESISPNPDQPRTNFKQEEIEELATSIQKDGLLQPILVRPVGSQKYQIIAGERRWQACRSIGMKTVPIRIKEADDDKALELALVENIQRSDLNPIEEAYGYRRMMERRNLTQSEVAPGNVERTIDGRQCAASSGTARRGPAIAVRGEDHGRSCACNPVHPFEGRKTEAHPEAGGRKAVGEGNGGNCTPACRQEEPRIGPNAPTDAEIV